MLNLLIWEPTKECVGFLYDIGYDQGCFRKDLYEIGSDQGCVGNRKAAGFKSPTNKAQLRNLHVTILIS